MKRFFSLALGCALIAGCGAQAPLTPAAGARLPVAPLGVAEQPTADELLRLDTQAAPQRSIELRRRSEDRRDDPFDLPPE
jgi:hypothetical protein